MIDSLSNTVIYIWPDNAWCHAHELEGMSHKSDDYRYVHLDDDMDDNDIDRAVHEGEL